MREGRQKKKVTVICPQCKTTRQIQARRGCEGRLCRQCWVKGQKGKKHLANRGENNGRWKGGRNSNSGGYIAIRLYPGDFFYSMTHQPGYVMEHRLVMAKHLGRCLHRWELVHHKGTKYPKGSIENRQDNRIENLQLVSDTRHSQITILENRITYLEKRVTLLEAENVILKTQMEATHA